jgi:DNA repair exonuclease SbcCD nuclease subunit
MSKILFTADWHIKLGQKNVPKEWQINRFKLLYQKLDEIALDEKVVAHIIGGDVFDSSPSLEELRLFSEFLINTKTTTFIFDGNHEATRKGKTFFEHLKPVFENLNKNICVLLGNTHNLLDMDVIPYTDLKTFNPKDFKKQILLTHVRGEIPPHVKPEIDLELLSRWKLVLAGDLHSHTNSQKNIIYPGSPMTTTFHRGKTKTGVIILETDTLEWKWIPLELPQLIRKTVENEDEMVATKYHHTVYELTGDLEQLSKVQKVNPLLDKKVVKRVVDSQIDFSKTETIAEELLLFLVEVKGIKDTDKIMRAFNDNVKTT